MKDKIEPVAYYGCCLIMTLLFAAIAVGLGYIVIAGLGAIVRMF